MFTVVIPARYGSLRLPGKPLLLIAGKPMIQHVYERAARSGASRVVVATDDERIARAVEEFGGECRMTRADHPSGTDRVQEVANGLGLSGDDIVVNVQGDEPLIPPAVIDQVAENLAGVAAGIATLCEPILDAGYVHDPNIVKVVADHQGFALYFSRAPIPFDRDGRFDTGLGLWRRHLGIYAYRVSFLDEFVTWQPSPIEQAERLEQLRAMWHGVRIHVEDAVESIPPGVDTREDLERVIAHLG